MIQQARLLKDVRSHHAEVEIVGIDDASAARLGNGLAAKALVLPQISIDFAYQFVARGRK